MAVYPATMSLVLSLLVAAPIILIVCGQSSDQPYMLGVANRAQGSNSVNLQCKNHVGVQVPGASFYRNSQQITNSSCLTAYPTGISSELNLTLVSQECDGYFSCGVNGTLSEPKPLYGKLNYRIKLQDKATECSIHTQLN